MQVTSLYLHLNQLNQATTPPTPRYLFLLQILTTEWRWSLTTPFFSTKPITKLLLPLWGGNLPWGDLPLAVEGFRLHFVVVRHTCYAKTVSLAQSAQLTQGFAATLEELVVL